MYTVYLLQKVKLLKMRIVMSLNKNNKQHFKINLIIYSFKNKNKLFHTN